MRHGTRFSPDSQDLSSALVMAAQPLGHTRWDGTETRYLSSTKPARNMWSSTLSVPEP